MNPDSLPFPCSHQNQMNGHPTEEMSGMFLRDHFAGLAMQAYLSNTDRGDFSYDEWAEASYEMADAMLKAREAK